MSWPPRSGQEADEGQGVSLGRSGVTLCTRAPRRSFCRTTSASPASSRSCASVLRISRSRGTLWMKPLHETEGRRQGVGRPERFAASAQAGPPRRSRRAALQESAAAGFPSNAAGRCQTAAATVTGSLMKQTAQPKVFLLFSPASCLLPPASWKAPFRDDASNLPTRARCSSRAGVRALRHAGRAARCRRDVFTRGRSGCWGRTERARAPC